MSDSMFFVSAAAVRNLKDNAEHRSRGVSSSHLSEAIAVAMGFKTNAALRAALAGKATVEVPKPSNARLVQRLRELGYTAPDDLRLVPEFEHSYTPFRSLPLRKTRSLRWTAWRNLMVAAVNAGLEQRLFGLSPCENWWPGGNPESQLCARYVYRFSLTGSHKAVASVDCHAGDELSIQVVFNPRPGMEPSSFYSLRDGDAYATAWIERRLGAWIQDGGEDFSCKRAVQPSLGQMKIDTTGYSDLGSFFM